ncbi:10802_t:CDS:2 [Rhizophagus irregularis]|nr:10802_t:CDS:2 [Rhizophagus irregularis]
MKNYYSLKTPKSTQILDKNIKVDKTIRPHIPIETQISNVFEIETEKIHAYTSENRQANQQILHNL